MHSCIFNLCSIFRSDGLHRLILRLSVRPYSGLVGEAAPPLVNFTPAFWNGWHLSIIVLFYKVYFNILDICLR